MIMISGKPTDTIAANLMSDVMIRFGTNSRWDVENRWKDDPYPSQQEIFIEHDYYCPGISLEINYEMEIITSCNSSELWSLSHVPSLVRPTDLTTQFIINISLSLSLFSSHHLSSPDMNISCEGNNLISTWSSIIISFESHILMFDGVDQIRKSSSRQNDDDNSLFFWLKKK